MKPLLLRLLCALTAGCVLGLAQPAAAQTLHLDPAHSSFTIYVYKQGLLAFAADNHEVRAPIASGSYDDATGNVQFTVQANQLEVLDPGASAGTRSAVLANMLGPKVLDVAKYPEISFRTTAIDKADRKHWIVTGELTLHGQSHTIVAQATRVDDVHFTGSAPVRQSAFGITPIKIAGGLAGVKDEVRVEFQIALTPAARL